MSQHNMNGAPPHEAEALATLAEESGAATLLPCGSLPTIDGRSHGGQSVSADAANEAFLEIRRAGQTPIRVRLKGSRVPIGRAVAADGLVLDHPSVSRDHAELSREATGRWWVRDRGSRNGTTVNGERVGESALNVGDLIGVGEYTLRLAAPERVDRPVPRRVAPTPDAAGLTLQTLADAEPPRIATEHIAGIMALGRELHETADAGERLHRLLRFAAGPELQGSCALALRLGDRPRDLDVRTLAGPVCRTDDAATPHVSLSLLRAVKARRQPVVANNLARLAQFQADVSVAGDATPFAAVACPLQDGDVGDVLYVVQPPHLGSVEWLMLNSLAVEQYRQAEAAWAARAAAEARAAVERELDLARVVQVRTVPRRTPADRLDWALSFSPCHAVGGDYVDVIRRRDGTVVLAIADVSGKGMQAALVSAAIHAVFNTLAGTGASLGDMAAAADRHVRTFLPVGGFATFAAVTLNPESGRGECVNCGHPAVIAAGGPGGQRLVSGGDHMPLGLAGEDLAVEPFELAPGECLILHTDGLSELRDPAGAMLGLARLREVFSLACRADAGARSADAIVAEISSFLATYAGGCHAADDQTFLIAKRRVDAAAGK
jgi:sigma-B regulation protein RsbU (phosphoserine phosphatase)